MKLDIVGTLTKNKDSLPDKVKNIVNFWGVFPPLVWPIFVCSDEESTLQSILDDDIFKIFKSMQIEGIGKSVTRGELTEKISIDILEYFHVMIYNIYPEYPPIKEYIIITLTDLNFVETMEFSMRY